MKTETKILEDKLDTTFNILLELEFLKNNINNISNKESKYFKNVSRNSQFFHTSYKAFLKLFVIEIYKLIDPKSDYNIQKTINFCKSNINKIEWHHTPKLDLFDILENKLDFDISDVEKIKNLRDKFYAHSDKNRKQFPYDVEKFKLWEVLENLQLIFRLICQEYNNLCWLFDIQYKGLPELRMISNYKEINKLLLFKKIEGKENISIDEIEKIIRK